MLAFSTRWILAVLAASAVAAKRRGLYEAPSRIKTAKAPSISKGKSSKSGGDDEGPSKGSTKSTKSSGKGAPPPPPPKKPVCDKDEIIYVNKDECFNKLVKGPLKNCEGFDDVGAVIADEGGALCTGPVSAESPCLMANDTFAFNSLLEGFSLSAPQPIDSPLIPDEAFVGLRQAPLGPEEAGGIIGPRIVQANLAVTFTKFVRKAFFTVVCPFDIPSPITGNRLGPCINTTVTAYGYYGELATVELPPIFPGESASVGVFAHHEQIKRIEFNEPDVAALLRDDAEYLAELCFEW